MLQSILENEIYNFEKKTARNASVILVSPYTWLDLCNELSNDLFCNIRVDALEYRGIKIFRGIDIKEKTFLVY